ncbi:MoxR family ATPase [Halobacterium salinarum]|jgi:MoxR-like ATPase|uniref:AAA family ATPase n=1 Tax=Halobacterium TaxID=2239 RepID=UPI0025559DCD|nr:MoxR family ATPase [Halobacterium salinarum]MDL0125594.1 MoxR family ATPase [Halobacterium salinarum]MDL0130144.1 MoxR family ATPase [Halobacterium salinarum]
MTDPASAYTDIRDEISTVLVGNDELIERFTISLLTGGHVLVEGVPGVAKTTAANVFARAIGMEFTRIQMTPDIRPADITGTHVYRESTGEFELERGPVFSNLVVADEINRATPKTQSALLEAMEEGNVTIEGETLALPQPFMVIATQNPIEMEGTFELPEAQRDRFQFKLTVEIPERADERTIIDRFDNNATLGPEAISQVLSPSEILDLREAVREVHVADPVKDYLLDVVAAVRESTYVDAGASPRASLAFLDAGKARAAIHGRDYVIPDDITALVEPILSHRLVLSTDASLSDYSVEDVLADALEDVPTPSQLEAEAPSSATNS